MFGSLAGFAKFLVLFAVWLVFATIFVSYTSYFLTRFARSSVVHIESFVGLGATEDTLGPYVVGRARELIARVPLGGLYEVNVPPLTHSFGTKDSIIRLPSDAKVSVGGFDLMAVANAFVNVFPDDRYTVSARPDSASSGSAIKLEWKAPSGAKRHWLLALEKDDGIKIDDKAAANKRLVDRAISQLLYYMHYGPKDDAAWVVAEKPKMDFPDARSLEAYYVGQQHLSAYLRTHDTQELEHAEREFRILQERSPGFVDGLMLLGLTHSERRNEREAVLVYEGAERVLERVLQAPPPTRFWHLEPDTRRNWNTLFQARLFKAVAHRKLYNWRDTHIAIGELDRLASAIRAELKLQPINDDLKMILATTLAEKANTIGYYLILLYHGNFIKAVTDPSMPESLSLTADQVKRSDRQKQIDDLEKSAPNDAAAKAELYKARKERNEDLRAVLDDLFKAQRNALTAAKEYAAEIKSSDPGLVSVLHSADGYTLFRDAQVRDDNDGNFRTRCDEALASHRLADAATPNNYLVLQNMAMIYGDPRYDSKNRDIGIARRLFKESVKFKPDDYFGNQNLATLAIRDIHLQGPELVKPELIKEGIDKAEKARDLAPQHWVTYIQLAQLYALRWAKETDSAKKKADETLVTASLAIAKGLKETSLVRLEVARLQWEMLRLRAETDSKKFEESKDNFGKSLSAALKGTDWIPGWERRKLVAVAGQLEKTLATATVENRLELRWPY